MFRSALLAFSGLLTIASVAVAQQNVQPMAQLDVMKGVVATKPAAQVDATLLVDGIPGDSKLRTGQIDVLQYSIGATQATGPNAGRATLHDLTITKPTDSSSPKLLQRALVGPHISSVVLTVAIDKSRTLRITLLDVVVSSATLSYAPGQDQPVDQITFSYPAIQVDYLVGGTIISSTIYDTRGI